MKQYVNVRVLPKEEEKKPKEFMKTAYKFNLVFAIFVTLMAYGLMFLSAFVTYIDLSPIGYIIPAVWAEVGVFSGFYAWKSKHENMSKAQYGDFNNPKINKVIEQEEDYDCQRN